jgi:hypothetical protein
MVEGTGLDLSDLSGAEVAELMLETAPACTGCAAGQPCEEEDGSARAPLATLDLCINASRFQRFIDSHCQGEA